MKTIKALLIILLALMMFTVILRTFQRETMTSLSAKLQRDPEYMANIHAYFQAHPDQTQVPVCLDGNKIVPCIN